MSKLNAGTLYRIGLIDWPKDQAVVKLETSCTTYTPSISKCLAFISFCLDFAIYLFLESPFRNISDLQENMAVGLVIYVGTSFQKMTCAQDKLSCVATLHLRGSSLFVFSIGYPNKV